jgi:hypothetical protein
MSESRTVVAIRRKPQEKGQPDDKFQYPMTTFEIPHLCPAKYSIALGEGGVPNFCLVES